MPQSARPLNLTDPRNPAPAAHQPRPPQLTALTSIRFFAALHVALYHLVRPFSLWGPFAGFMAAGYTGVSFFFLLSGFILTYTHAAEPSTGPAFRRRFFFARFARIYPVYLLTTIAAGIVLHKYFAQPLHILAYLADLAMLQTWSVRMVSFFNVPAWSVSMEAVFYAIFPFVFLRLRPRSRSTALGGMLAFWLLALVMPVVALVLYPASAMHEGVPGLFAFWVRRFPPFAIPEFLFGIMLGWFFLRHPPTRRQSTVLAAAGLTGLVLVLYFADHLPMLLLHNGLLLPLDALLLLGLTQPNPLARLLSHRWLLLLGEASYSLYLTHFMFGDWLDATFHLDQGFRTLALKLAILLPLCIALFLYVERPTRKALLQRWNRAHSRQ